MTESASLKHDLPNHGRDVARPQNKLDVCFSITPAVPRSYPATKPATCSLVLDNSWALAVPTCIPIDQPAACRAAIAG